MAVVDIKTGLTPKRVLAHAITVDGRKVLVEASGDVSLRDKIVAAWNLRRWNRGHRTWLL